MKSISRSSRADIPGPEIDLSCPRWGPGSSRQGLDKSLAGALLVPGGGLASPHMGHDNPPSAARQAPFLLVFVPGGGLVGPQWRHNKSPSAARQAMVLLVLVPCGAFGRGLPTAERSRSPLGYHTAAVWIHHLHSHSLRRTCIHLGPRTALDPHYSTLRPHRI